MTNSEQDVKKQVTNTVWKLVMARGIFLISVGLILLIFPTATLTTLIFIMGLYWLIDGIVTVIHSIQRRNIIASWWWGLLIGVLSVVAGLIVVIKPLSSAVFTTSFLMWFLGIVAVVNGISGLVTGIRLHKVQQGERSMIWGGVFSILLGFLLLSSPFTSALVIIKVLGAFAIFAGIITLYLAQRIKKKAEELQ